MGDSFQYGDVIFLGLIAVFVLLRLRAMLGKHAGDPRAWRQVSRDLPVQEAAPAPRPARRAAIEETPAPSDPGVAAGLKAIKAADASFSTTEFLGGARLAFEWVLDAYARGDREKLKTLLAAKPFEHFVAEIDARPPGAARRETTLVSILAADITEAALNGRRASITVQFTSEQIHVTREGAAEHGNVSEIEKVIDVWTFERATVERDPNWIITAT